MSENNDTPQMIVVDIPSEFADAGFLASVRTEDGKLDVAKALKKMQNQESALGKRALPNKDSSDAEIDEFIEKMKGNFSDVDLDSLFADATSVKELKTALKDAGVLPKQAAKIVAAYKKDLNQQYDENEFEKMVNDALNKEDLAMAKRTLSDGEWEEIFKTRNKEAVGRLCLAANLGKRFNITEKGIGAGAPSNGVRDFSKKGMCPEYVAEMKEAAARGATQKEKDAIMSKYGYNHELGGWDI
nr:MAG TPA: hypothetical protein [Microviridae sp.]